MRPLKAVDLSPLLSEGNNFTMQEMLVGLSMFLCYIPAYKGENKGFAFEHLYSSLLRHCNATFVMR